MAKNTLSKNQFGMTLVELLVVIVIIAILAAIAVPNYTQYVRKSHRIDAETGLLVTAINLEKYFSQNNTYVGATLANTNSPSAVPEGEDAGDQTYSLGLSNLSVSTFTVTATAINGQVNDTDCVSFSINQSGTKSSLNSEAASSTNECW
jgi:type IV pilus assembly protein PilE